MAPVTLITIIAVLALGAQAKTKDKIRVIPFVDVQCQGYPASDPFDLQRDQCKNVNLQSVKFDLPSKGKYSNWWATPGTTDLQSCEVVLYDGPGCVDPATPNGRRDHTQAVQVPKEIHQCKSPFPQGMKPKGVIGSMKFRCHQPGKYVSSKTITATYYSKQKGFAAPGTTLSTFTTTYTGFTLLPRFTSALELPAQEPDLESRAVLGYKANPKPHWYKHPWTGEYICMVCFTKKNGNLGPFVCKSKPNDPSFTGCGPYPTTHTTTMTTTSTSTTTINKPKFLLVRPTVTKSETTEVEITTSTTTVDSTSTVNTTVEVQVTVTPVATSTLNKIPTTTTTVDYTSTIDTTVEVQVTVMPIATTTLDQALEERSAPTSVVLLEARSDKRKVKMDHPYAYDGFEQVCALAKWHKHGSNKNEIDIYGPKKCSKSNNEMLISPPQGQ